MLSVANAVNAGNATNANTIGGYTVDALKSLFINSIYPIGSIYTSISSTNPSTLFGGTWEQIKDTFLLASGSVYSAGSTGGEAAHTLTAIEMPSHTHGAWGVNDGTTVVAQMGNYPIRIYQDKQANWNVTGIDYAGGSQPHNNMPPYLAVYMWKRIS